MRTPPIGRILFLIAVTVAVAASLAGAGLTSTAYAKAAGATGVGPNVPNVYPCEFPQWIVLDSAPFSHMVNNITWQGNVDLWATWDENGFNVYCGRMKATASLTVTLGADSGTVQAGLYNGTNTPKSSTLTVSGGETLTATVGPYTQKCGEALGYYAIPAIYYSTSIATGYHCP